MKGPAAPNKDRRLIGLDVGGTKIAAGTISLPSLTVHARRVIPTDAHRGGKAVLDDVVQLTRGLLSDSLADGHEVSGIGLGICEIVDRNGRLASAQTIGWLDQPVHERFKEMPGLILEADVRAAAMAEGFAGAGRNLASYLYVTIGTGISCCLMQEGTPHLGATGATGTMASSPLSILCEECDHCSSETLEEFSSGPALVTRYRNAGGKANRAEDVIAAASGGDARAIKVVADATTALGSQIGLLVNVLDPEAVIIGGGLGSADGPFWDHLVVGTRRHIWSNLNRQLPVVRATTGPDAGWIGAAVAAWQKSVS